MEHECEWIHGRRLSIDFYRDDQNWYMSGGAIKNRCIVFHCPYCGVKLETPLSPARKNGLEFVRRVREVAHTIEQEYSDPCRYASGVAFQLLVMFDGQFEGRWDDNYRVQVKCGDTWENMEFDHHDL